MHRILHFVFYVSFTSLFGCAAGSGTTARSEFTDDLTAYRIKVESTRNENASANQAEMVSWGDLAFDASVTKDIDALVAQMARTNLRVESFPGYRIQVYSAGDRNEAEKVIKYLEEKLEIKVPIYLNYEQPNFKVKIGDYTNRVKAYEMHFLLKEEYPDSIIIRDKVAFDVATYLNPLKDKKDEEEKKK